MYRYGNSALKLPTMEWWSRRPLKAQLSHPLPSREQFERAFRDSDTATWVREAHSKLLRNKHREIAAYLMGMTNNVVEGQTMCSRLRQEQKLWALFDTKVQTLWDRMNRLDDWATTELACYVSAVTPQTQAPINTQNFYLFNYLRAGGSVCKAAADLQRLLALECTYIQFLVLGLIKQDENTRQFLLKQRPVIALRRRIRDGNLDRAAQAAWDRPLLLWQNWQDKVVGRLDPGLMEDRMHSESRNFKAMVDDLLPKMSSTLQTLLDLETTIQNCTGPGPLSVAAPQFASLTAATVQGPGYLKHLALRRMRQMRPDDEMRPVIGKWLDILVSAKQLEGSMDDERAAIS